MLYVEEIYCLYLKPSQITYLLFFLYVDLNSMKTKLRKTRGFPPPFLN